MSGNAPDPSELSKLELEHLIRVARAARDLVVEQKLQLQERELSLGDGHVREAILGCENVVFVLTNAIAKLWMKLYPEKPSKPTPSA